MNGKSPDEAVKSATYQEIFNLGLPLAISGVANFGSKFLRFAKDIELLDKSGEEINEIEDIEEDAEAAGKVDSFYRKNPSDPIRDVIGPGMQSHPEEWDRIISDLDENGVEVKYRKGVIGYAPGSEGDPGQILIDPDASISALRHEYQHFLDAKAEGFPLLVQSFGDWQGRIIKELRAYMKEIDYAESMGEKDVAEQLWENYRAERQYIIDRYGPIK